MKTKDFAVEIVLRLNRLIENENVRKDILKLMRNKIECSSETADHPYITVSSFENKSSKTTDFLGTLGILNGMLETTDFKLAMVVDSSDTELLRFELIYPTTL
jgi:hypothetical protein